MTLGRHRGRLVAAEAGQSVIVVAPTQTGKTTGLAVPALLEWKGPILATSVKNDLLRDTLDRRAELGEVKLFDPTATTRLERELDAARGLRRMAGRTTNRGPAPEAAQFSTRTLQDADFWARAGARFLAPLLLAAGSHDRTMTDVGLLNVSVDDAEENRGALGTENMRSDPGTRPRRTEPSRSRPVRGSCLVRTARSASSETLPTRPRWLAAMWLHSPAASGPLK